MAAKWCDHYTQDSMCSYGALEKYVFSNIETIGTKQFGYMDVLGNHIVSVDDANTTTVDTCVLSDIP